MVRPSRSSSVVGCCLLTVLTLACTRDRGQLWVQPYLQNPGPDSMTILWWTNESRPGSYIEYGEEALDTVAAATNLYVETMDKWSHEVTLTALKPEARYKYRARSGDLVSDGYTFRAAKSRDSDLLLSFLGDGRTDDDAVIARHRKLVEMAATSDLIFEVGDVVFDGSVEHWGRFLRRILTASDAEDPGAATGSTVPYQLVVGNHEIGLLPPGMSEDEATDWDYFHQPFETMLRFKAIVSNPPNGAANEAWEERYYTLRYGCVTFIVLDANNTSDDAFDNHDPLSDGTTPDWQPGSDQYQWLIEQLERAQSESSFTFVLFHPSPYSRGEHGTPDREKDTQRGHELRTLQDVFLDYGVDAVITSHDHLVEYNLDGPDGFESRMDADDPRHIHHFVIGNSGHSARGAGDGWEQWMSVRKNGKPPYHTVWFYTWENQDERCSFVKVSVANNGDGSWTASFSVVRDDGETFALSSIRRRDPQAASPAPPGSSGPS